MKVLLLHPVDHPARIGLGHYDLIVDLGWAPDSSYRNWSQQFGCEVTSLKSFSRGTDDLSYLRRLLDLGRGKWLDASGVDWWEVLSVMIHTELYQFVLALRLRERIRGCTELVATRDHLVGSALATATGQKAAVLQRDGFASRCSRIVGVLTKFKRAQLLDIAHDKYDPYFIMRRRFAPTRLQRSAPVVLLPSAYVNVTRTELECARLLPEQRFLLVSTRNSGRLSPLPANVNHTPLASYAVSQTKWRDEAGSLRENWRTLESELSLAAAEFRLAADLGLFARMTSLLDWGLALRDAWHEVFATENVVSCLSADEGNPATRLPLILAGKRGIPTVACHHGALDYGLSLRRSTVGTHVVQSAMESDYAMNVCRIHDSEFVEGALGAPKKAFRDQKEQQSAPWLAFFTEPYEIDGGRADEIYREVIPRLCQVARQLGKRVILKLHPFESVKRRRHELGKVLSPADLASVDVVDEQMTPELWQKVCCVVTIQSTVGVEAAARRIPVFLMGWLAAHWTGYAEQFAKFGIGTMLHCPEDLNLIATASAGNSKTPQPKALTEEALARALCHRRESMRELAAPAGGA
jgi:capsular polysaccharide biosynthesis protein